jgi:hypothetical protein
MPQIQDISSKAFHAIGEIVKAVGGFVTNVLLPAFGNFWAWLEPNLPKMHSCFKG